MIKHKLQNCQTCTSQGKCLGIITNTGKPISTSNVMINLLICRIQLGINVDKSVALLLKLLRPGMVGLISHMKQAGNTPGIDMEQLLTEMQSTAIEYLLYDYKIGDRGRATPYLFDPHQGFLTKWIKWMIGKNRRFYSHHELYDPNGSTNIDYDEDPHYQTQWTSQDSGGNSWDSIMEGSGSEKYDPYSSDESEESNQSQEILNIIEDGYTVNSNEYRVIKYCLTNANEVNNSRHIDGLHLTLAKLMCVSRPRITRLYARSKAKIKARYSKSIKEKI